VADGEIATQRAQLLLVEDLVDEPEIAQGHDVAADVGSRDPGGLLATVLQGVQREVRKPRDVVSGCIDPEDAALVPRSFALVEGGHDIKDSQAFGC
jgi:hypothetical protein